MLVDFGGGEGCASKFGQNSNNSKRKIPQQLSLPENSKRFLFIFVRDEAFFRKIFFLSRVDTVIDMKKAVVALSHNFVIEIEEFTDK